MKRRVKKLRDDDGRSITTAMAGRCSSNAELDATGGLAEVGEHENAEVDEEAGSSSSDDRALARARLRMQRKEQQREKKAAKAAKAAAKAAAKKDVEGLEEDEDEEEDDSSPPLLEVRPSTIPGAGDGLFLVSRFKPSGTILLSEEAPPLKRAAATKIMNLPEWRGKQPVIQLSGDRFLDIRQLLLYKTNHAESSSPKCNAYISQVGPTRLTITASRGIWHGEEIMWEYSPTMQQILAG